MSRILIVDDDPHLGRSVERVLEHEGYLCLVALDPTSAAEAAAEFKPDLILIELQPGYTPALPQLRAAVGEVPFVFMAGHQDEYAGLGDLVGPADDWVAKPAAPRELVARLRTVLRRTQQN
ncbi:MAG TPA: response regulator [Candidatus Limnocylindria bacterium]|nr:response regulator [Candidatus Limnocylindria bacterium]